MGGGGGRAGVGGGGEEGGVLHQLELLPQLLHIFGQSCLSKQCRRRLNYAGADSEDVRGSIVTPPPFN